MLNEYNQSILKKFPKIINTLSKGNTYSIFLIGLVGFIDVTP